MDYKISKLQSGEYSISKRDGTPFKISFSSFPVESVQVATLEDAKAFLKSEFIKNIRYEKTLG